MEKGSLTESAGSLQEGEKIYRQLLSPNSIAIFDNLRLQAQVSHFAGNYAEATRQINLVLKNYRQNSNPKCISYATALTVQGLILNKLEKADEAEITLREAVRLRTENLPAKHFMTAITKGAFGEILTARGKYDEAEPLLLASYEDLTASPTERIQTAKRRLAQLYDAWNKPEAAGKCR